MKFPFIIIALCFGLNSFGNSPSPLAAYSQQWNLPMFEKANTAANVSFLNATEKEFVHVLNLARMNPYLFSETVLKKFAKDNGYTFPIVNMIEQMKYARPAGLLEPHDYYKNEMNSWVDSIMKNRNEKFEILSRKTNMKNAACLISGAMIPVELLCHMIADEDAGTHTIRNLILSDNKSISIIIRKETEWFTVLNFDEKSPLQLANYQASIEAEKERLKREEKARNTKYLFYNECQDDNVLQYFMKKNELDIKNAVFVSEKQIDSIENMLRASKMNIVVRKKSAEIEVSKIIPKKKNVTPQYSYFTWSYFNADESDGDYDIEKPFHYFTFNRSIPDSAGEYLNVAFKEIKNPPLIPPFPVDSIGTTPPAIDYNRIDNYSKSIGTLPIKQLAITLTKPWKTEAEKVRAIFKWMDYNLQYDYQGLATGRMTTKPNDVLAKKVAVCQGYAELFTALCDAVGIRNKLIIGVAKKSENEFPGHAWNAVCINKKWYLIDVTWGEGFYLKSPSYFYYDHFPNQNRWTLFPEFHAFQEFKESKKERDWIN
jgi:transglutaminase-like putative cysteine protease